MGNIKWGIICYEPTSVGDGYNLNVVTDTPLGIQCPVGTLAMTQTPVSNSTFQRLSDQLNNEILFKMEYIRCLSGLDQSTVFCRPNLIDVYTSQCGPGEIRASLY